MSEIESDSSHQEEETVEIVLKTIGPLRPSRLKIPPRIKVHSLRALIAANESLPIEIVSLISRGSVLEDSKGGKEAFTQFSNGDTLMVAVKPKAPRKKIPLGYDDDDDEDEDDLKFQLPERTSRWKWKLFRLLRDKMHCPDIILMGIFSLSVKAWAIIILWFITAPLAHSWDLGPLYILGTGFAIIFLNLGKRQAGDSSAYSIFNEDFRELPGTLNADRLDRDTRAGQF